MDATAPPPDAPPAQVAYAAPAATDERPRSDRELQLCEKASHFDWLYFTATIVGDVAAIYLDNEFKIGAGEGVHYLTASGVGLAWGWTLSGAYLSLPKCSPTWVQHAPPEGDVRSAWPIAVATAALAGVMSPLLMGTEIGSEPQEWSERQRSLRVVFTGVGGIAGALLPYLLPPKTWSAAKELQNMRAGTTDDGRGAFFSWTVRF